MNSASPDRRSLRQRLIAEREALSPLERRQRTAELIVHLAQLLDHLDPQTLAFCWPFRGEPDLVEFLSRWRAQRLGRSLALPIVPESRAALAFHAWQPGDPMQTDRFGIPAPKGMPSLVPEVVLVPVNGFDARGYRIGYGGGFFDHTFAALKPAPISIGIGFELARLDDVLPEAHDLALNWVVTEAGVVVRPSAEDV